MTEEQKKNIALFRFGVISELIGRKDIRRGEREAVIRELTTREWEIPDSVRTRVSRSTIREWLRRYEASGRKIESLFPKDRSDSGQSRSMDSETELALVELKRQFPEASLPVILKLGRRRNIVPQDFSASSQSIYRLFKRHCRGHVAQPCAMIDIVSAKSAADHLLENKIILVRCPRRGDPG